MLSLLLATAQAAQAQTVLDQINGRFLHGAASSGNLTTAGVIIHQFDNWNDPSSQWLPCPTSMWCANFSDRWSTSLINVGSPTKDEGGQKTLNLYNDKIPGFILSATGNELSCSYPGDGGTSLRTCDAAGKVQGCIPGCYTEQGNHWPVPDGQPCWCDTGVTSCPSGQGATGPSACAWRPSELSQMLTAQQHYNSYNELIFATKPYTASLPSSLEAFFYMVKSQDDQRKMVTDTHAHFLSTYGRTTAQTPLLQFDPTNLGMPFTCVAC